MIHKKIFSNVKLYVLVGIAVFSLSQCAEDEEILSPSSPSLENISTETGAPLSLNISGIHTFADAPVECKTCKYVVASNETLIDGKALGIKPGDIICLDAAKKYGSLDFINLYGTLEKPIVIANTDSRIK